MKFCLTNLIGGAIWRVLPSERLGSLAVLALPMASAWNNMGGFHRAKPVRSPGGVPAAVLTVAHSREMHAGGLDRFGGRLGGTSLPLELGVAATWP